MTSGCTYDPDARADFWTAQVTAGTEFNPIDDGFGDYDFGGTFTSGTLGGTDFSDCATDPSACLDLVGGSGFTQGCFSNADCPSGATCTSGQCVATQSGTFNFAGTLTVSQSGGTGCAPQGGTIALSGSGTSYTLSSQGGTSRSVSQGPARWPLRPG